MLGPVDVEKAGAPAPQGARLIALGVDPDLHDCAFATWDNQGPGTAWVVHCKRDQALSGPQRVQRMIHAALRSPELLASHAPAFDPFDAFVVEGQSLRRTGAAQHKRPGDIVKLAQVAGGVYAMLLAMYDRAAAFLPEPEEWKGSVAKHAMQGRLYNELGWGYEIVGEGTGRYARPLRTPQSFRGISKGQWKHAGDALLLARWAHREVSK